MQSVSSRIWTRVAVSYDDNHYTTGTSNSLVIIIIIIIAPMYIFERFGGQKSFKIPLWKWLTLFTKNIPIWDNNLYKIKSRLLEYADWISAEGQDHLQIRVQDMALNSI